MADEKEEKEDSSIEDSVSSDSFDSESESESDELIVIPQVQAETKKKLTQQELLLLAEENLEVKKPEWLLRAQKSRTNIIAELENKRAAKTVEFEKPEWIQKAIEAQISRDLRGIEKYLNKKAPALPPEPEWIRKATKRRDLTQLNKITERAHVSNVQAPDWVQSEGAQKILNSVFKKDEKIIPEWMNKGVEMNTEEKESLLAEIAKFQQLLDLEIQLTKERETSLSSATEALGKSKVHLNDCINAYRSLRGNRKAVADSELETVQNLFEESTAVINSYKIQFDITTIVENAVVLRQHSEKAKREDRHNKRKAARKEKKKNTPKKSRKTKKTDDHKTSDDSPSAEPKKQKTKKKKSSRVAQQTI